MKMRQSLLQLTLVLCLAISRSGGKILRNNALMSKMVSDFRAPPQARVADIMRNVLCRHFPAIPCTVITKDDALRSLILRTVKLMKDKQRHFQNATNEEAPITQQTEVPVINSEELSHYLAVENTGYFTDRHTQKQNKERRVAPSKPASWPDDVERGQSHLRAVIPGRKNTRKYFPHKIKYKDKIERIPQDNTRDKPPISEEIPDTVMKKRAQQYSFKREPSNMPMWQIDYTKHGEPRLPAYSQETVDQLKGKLVKVTADTENNVPKHRKSVLHPNVYIKNSLKRDMNYK